MTRLEMAQKIVNFEAGPDRRDKQGHLKVYLLPKNDSGGKYEVAGICDKHHPGAFRHLKMMLDSFLWEEAERYAVDYIARYTDKAALWSNDWGVQFFLRDCAFNRGPGGAAKILQIAVGAKVDGDVGPETRTKIARFNGEELLKRLRSAREHYEYNYIGKREGLDKGLVNRWNNALKVSMNC